MMYLIYNFLLYIFFIFSLPFYLFKYFTTEKYRVGLKDRLGFIRSMPKGKKILVHTVSVGEFLGAIPLINGLKKGYPDYKIIVSTTTVTGNRVAKKRYEDPSSVVFFPLDFGWSVKRFLDRISPDLIILVETELWPNFLRISGKRNIPVLVLNGRISDKSFRNYSLLRGLFKQICSSVRIWGVQSEKDKNRLVKLGIDPVSLYVTGSIKIDSAASLAQEPSGPGGSDELVIVGGSTHDGEEKILLDIYKEIKDNFKKLVLTLVPRHPERAEKIKKLAEDYKDGQEDNIVIIDTIGELISIYKRAALVFIGKSFVNPAHSSGILSFLFRMGGVKGGGQNLLEPAALGKPVICGPLMWNFSDITEWLRENKAIIQVNNIDELKQWIIYLLNNPEEGKKIGNRARELILNATGAVERNMGLVEKVIK